MENMKKHFEGKMIKKVRFYTLMILFLGIIPQFIFAENQQIKNIPRLSRAPKIDGVLEGNIWEAESDKLRVSVTNRDNILTDDWVAVFLDTFNEKRRAFSFMINPLGIQMDLIRIEEGGSDNMDPSWDTVFYSNGIIDEDGYTVEIAVPFKSIRFPDRDDKIWGITLGRTIARSGEVILWPPMSRSIPGLLTQAEEMMIRGEVEKGKNFELMPIFTSLKTKGAKVDAQPGINFKWGISSDLTMDLTVNPDFSQIEADVPLQMVYTRRIIDPIAGAKLTGKVGRFTYGLLSAYDTSPTENLWEVHNGGSSRENNALFNIFRMKADVLKESYIGFSLTDKEIDGSFNRVAGIDGQFKLKKKLFFSFQAMASKSRFGEEVSDISPAFFGEIGYYTEHLGGGLNWTSIHPEFEAASGFVNRVDYRTFGVYTYAAVYPEKKYLNQLRFNLRAGRRFDYDMDVLEDDWISPSIQVRFTEFSRMNFSYRFEMEHYGGVDFSKNSFTASGELIFLSWLPFGFNVRTGDSIFYDPDDPFLGYSNSFAIFATLKPSKRLQIGLTFSKETFWEELGGEQLYDFNVIRQRTTYQFTKSFSLRTVIDYNHFNKEIYGSFLVSYILKPGTVFFLGIDNNLSQNDLSKYTRDDYSVFVKFSYWHRI
jgi:hypothetical protein